HRIVLAPRHAESPTEAVEGPVGDDDHRRRHPLGFAPADQVDSDEEAVFHDRFRFGLLPHPDPLLLGEGGDLLVQVAAPDHPTPVGKARMLGPLQLEHDRVAGVRAEPVYAVEAGDVEVEAHLAELEDRPRREPVAAGLVAGVFLPLDEGPVVAGASQPIGGRRSRRAGADYEEGRRGHCHGGYRSPGGGGNRRGGPGMVTVPAWNERRSIGPSTASPCGSSPPRWPTVVTGPTSSSPSRAAACSWPVHSVTPSR